MKICETQLTQIRERHKSFSEKCSRQSQWWLAGYSGQEVQDQDQACIFPVLQLSSLEDAALLTTKRR